VASRTEVERKLHELKERLDASDEGARTLGGSLPEARVLALRVNDLDAEFWTELRGGRMGPIHEGSAEQAHIRIRADSDDLVQLIDGPAGGLFSAYLGGRLRVDASLSDLLRLRKLL
jgi:predicted lipid carrier protein YhbT